jgi:predicted O-methyltransferase YrrM
MKFDKIKDILHPNDPTGKEFLSWYPEYYGVKQEIVQQCKPNIICEIGIRAGYSAMAFLDACPDAIYFGFDADNGSHGGHVGFTDWARSLLKKAGYAHKIWAPFNTQEVLCLPVRADFYHVDGDHTTDGCYHDIKMCFEDAMPGAYILVDDFDFLGDVRRAVNSFINAYTNAIIPRYIKSKRGEMLIRKL